MKRNRKILITLAVILILASTGLVAIAMQPNPRDLLVDALTLTETVTDGHAVASFEFEAQGESGSGTVEVWGKLGMGPNGEPALRVEVLEASLGEFAGATAVTDGLNFWLYSPSQNKVLTGTLDELAIFIADQMAGHDFNLPDHDPSDGQKPETPEEAVDQLLTYFNAERNGYTEIGGDRAIALRLIPIPEQMPDEVRAAGGYVNLWLRPDDRAVVGAELAESAAGYALARATTLEINQGVADDIFTFAIPEGAEVIQVSDLELPQRESLSLDEAAAAADMVILTPTELPAEAALVETAVVRGAIVQQYSLPQGKSFTVAQGQMNDRFTPDEAGTAVTVRGVEGLLFASEDGGRTLLSWAENGIQFWIGGDLTPAEALATAESLQ